MIKIGIELNIFYSTVNVLPYFCMLRCFFKSKPFEVILGFHWLQGFLASSWTAGLCLVRLLFELALWSHCPQGYLSHSRTAHLCRVRSCFKVALWPHCPQVYFTPLWTFLCVVQDPSLKLTYDHTAHCPQGYFTPSWTALSCWTRSPFEVAIWLHCPQVYVTPSWTALLCWARLCFVVAL